VDKFRYNAKRASLVQSRIKAIEREVVVDAVEEEVTFSFSFPDCGQLGRPVIQIEGVTFGYKNEPLFRDIHLGIDQNSRIALVGPNGSGKVRAPVITILYCCDNHSLLCTFVLI
jgi:ATP-binding cassette subfamily F protein 3